MKKTFALLALLMLSCPLFAQTKASLKGILLDSMSKKPLEFATVALVNAKDTSLISYTLSLQNGAFKLTGLPTARATRLIISYAGYNTFRKNLELKPGELDLGNLTLAGKTLAEVTVRGERSPVVMKKDTIEFNAEAFKTRPNATVEELLRLLPGIQVNFDGTLTANGKGTNKLLIDGKRFFGDDPRVATKNLDASMIDKIQVYDDRDDDPDHKISDADVGKIINLKMKSKIKKSTLGKFYAGGGSRDRYEGGGIISNFRDTLQVSVIGSSNNLNSTGFSYDELYNMGGFNRSGGSQAWDGTFGGRSGGGLERLASAGLNINNNYGKELKLNLGYYYTTTKRDNQGSSISEQTLTNTILSGASINNTVNNNQKHALSGLIEWVPDTLRRLRYDPRANFSPSNYSGATSNNTFNTQTPKLTESFGKNSSQAYNNSFSHSFNYYVRSRNKVRSISISHDLAINTSGSDSYGYSNTQSFTSSLAAQILDRYTDNNNGSKKIGVSINYNQKLDRKQKITLELFSNTRYSDISGRGFVYDKSNLTRTYDSLSANLSREQVRYSFLQNFKPQLSFELGKQFNIRLGMDFEYQFLDNHFGFGYANTTQRYHYWFPSFQMNLKAFSASYSEYINQTDIDQLQPIQRVYSQTYISIGNPGLLPSRIRETRLSYSKYFDDKQLYLYTSAGATFTGNSIVSKTTVDGDGKTVSSYVNRNGAWNASWNLNLGKQFKKQQNWQVGNNINASAYFSKNPYFLNGEDITQTSYSIYGGDNINFNYTSLLTLTANYNIRGSLSQNSGSNTNKISTLTHTVGSGASLRWPKKVIWDTRYAYNYNAQVPEGFPKSSNIITAAISVMVQKKERGQIKLSVYDLLNQNISVSRYASNNMVYTTEQSILRQYFLITYQYKFNSFK